MCFLLNVNSFFYQSGCTYRFSFLLAVRLSCYYRRLLCPARWLDLLSVSAKFPRSTDGMMSITLLLLAGLCLYFLLFCGFSVLCSCSVSLSLFNSIFSPFNSTIFAKYFLFVWPKFTIQHTFWKILSIFPDTAFRIHEITEYHRTNWIVLSSLASLDHLTKQTWLQRLPIRQKAMDKGPGNLLAYYDSTTH